MKIGIISDTHMPRGQRRLPDRCVAELASSDVILHAGDLMTAAVLDMLESIGPPVHAVLGNVDDHTLRGRLPEYRTVEAGSARIAMIHDAGPASRRLQRMRLMFDDADAVVFGHSHIPLHETSEDGAFQIFNPGSPTDRRRQPRHSMGIATASVDGLAFEHVWLD